MTARDTVMSAGWAFSVNVKSFQRPAEHDGGELLPQRRIDLIEYGASPSVNLRQLGAHADCLTSSTLEIRTQWPFVPTTQTNMPILTSGLSHSCALALSRLGRTAPGVAILPLPVQVIQV